MAIILQGKINEYPACLSKYDQCAFSGYALFWTGVSVGFSNLFCGYCPHHLESVLEFQEVGVRLQMPRTPTPS